VEAPAQHIKHKTTLPTRNALATGREKESAFFVRTEQQRREEKRREEICELGVESRVTATQRKLKSL
jgi:hypothetical protein